MNDGERNELIVKFVLIYLRDNAPNCVIDNRKINITSVGLSGVEYKTLPSTIKSIDDIKGLNSNEEIKEVALACSATKAGAFDKADVAINNEGYSIKSIQTAPPAIVNHTARDGWEKVCTRIGYSIHELDEIIANYWELRKAGIIKEDSSNSDMYSPFKSHKEYLKPLLNYFLFKGSAAKDSPTPASYILDILNPYDISTWKIYDNDFLDKDSHWEKLVFSIRAKKGMNNYPNIRDTSKKKSMEKWVEFFQGEYRGALHIRLKK